MVLECDRFKRSLISNIRQYLVRSRVWDEVIPFGLYNYMPDRNLSLKFKYSSSIKIKLV